MTDRIRREKGLFRPFLSANDRSRWLTIRSLAERGTFAIEDFAAEPGWDTIDAVVHPDKDGKLHLYSSKPPLLSVLLAGPYWLATQMTGWTLGDHPFFLGRIMLLLYGVLPLAIIITMSCCCIELVRRDRQRPNLVCSIYRLWNSTHNICGGSHKPLFCCSVCCHKPLLYFTHYQKKYSYLANLCSSRINSRSHGSL